MAIYLKNLFRNGSTAFSILAIALAIDSARKPRGTPSE